MEETQPGATASSTNNCNFSYANRQSYCRQLFLTEKCSKTRQGKMLDNVQRCPSHQQPGALYNLQAEVEHETEPNARVPSDCLCSSARLAWVLVYREQNSHPLVAVITALTVLQKCDGRGDRRVRQAQNQHKDTRLTSLCIFLCDPLCSVRCPAKLGLMSTSGAALVY